MADLERFIIITGASDGLGLRLAHLFANEGANLLLTGRRSKSRLDHPMPQGATYLKADQNKRDCSELILAQVEKMQWPRIDNLILNAGTGFATIPGEELPDTIEDTLEVNLLAPIEILHRLTPFMLNGVDQKSNRMPTNSCVTLIGSPAHNGAAKFASYAASKAGLTGFARALASEWQDRATVQIIHPGPTNTDMQKKAGLDLGKMQQYLINPDYCARQIKRFIKTQTRNATISLPRYYGHLLSTKLGFAALTNPIIPA